MLFTNAKVGDRVALWTTRYSRSAGHTKVLSRIATVSKVTPRRIQVDLMQFGLDGHPVSKRGRYWIRPANPAEIENWDTAQADKLRAQETRANLNEKRESIRTDMRAALDPIGMNTLIEFHPKGDTVDQTEWTVNFQDMSPAQSAALIAKVTDRQVLQRVKELISYIVSKQGMCSISMDKLGSLEAAIREAEMRDRILLKAEITHGEK